ncbi:MAG: (2Fe-2S) ferredoxin domain-containing protein, partial [Kovacikia sp.]
MGFPDTTSRMEFNFEGQFLGFMSHDGTFKYIRLKVLSEEMRVKIPKPLRLTLGLSLQPGDALQVIGMGKFDRNTHELKLKAAKIIPLPEHCPPTEPPIPSNPLPARTLASTSKPKGRPKFKVLICQKSGCLKRGGRGLCEALQKMLCAHNLDQDVTIKPTGCLKHCSSAPNLVIMPGNHRYKDVRLKTLPQVIDSLKFQEEEQA